MKKTIKYLLLALAFTPLLVDMGAFFPFVTGKMMLIKGIVTIVALLSAGYAIYDRKFREEIGESLRRIKNNPLTMAIGGWLLIAILSTILAFWPERAFFGELERAEGLISLAFFLGWFIYAVIWFKKEEWINFFKLSLGVSLVLFIHSGWQWLSGFDRPGSTLGNSLYLAQYYLFIVMAAVVVVRESGKNSSFWKTFGWLSSGLALLGILITGTRGVALGAVAGIIGLLIYLAIWGGEKKIGWLATKKLAGWALLVLVLLGGGFWLTREANIWQLIPGFDRVAGFTLEDATFKTREISAGVAIESVKPGNEGWGRTLFGWGLDNYKFAFSAYYDQDQYKYESAWFDRAHNKLLDVLVMNGVLGLAAYLLVWFFIGKAIWQRRKEGLIAGAAAWFAIAYFTQNLFAFESTAIYLIWFGWLAFLIGFGDEDGEGSPLPDWMVITKTTVLAAIFLVLFFGFTWGPYLKVRTFKNLVDNPGGRPADFLEDIKETLEPYSFTQNNIRVSWLSAAYTYEGDKKEEFRQAADQAIEDLIEREPYDPAQLVAVANVYSEAANRQGGDSNLYQKTENLLRQALEISPNKPDLSYSLAYNLALQGKKDQAISLLEQQREKLPEVGEPYFYLGIIMATGGDGDNERALENLERAFEAKYFVSKYNNLESLQAIYQSLMFRFWKQKDANNFITTAERLKELQVEATGDLEALIELAKRGGWEQVELE